MLRTTSWTCALALAGFLAPAVAEGAVGGPVGTYLVEDGGSQVEFYDCGQATCGRISWMRERTDESGRPFVDENNPDPAQRAAPLLGLTILIGLLPGEKRNQYEGEVYNPRDGNRYPVSVTIKSDNEIKVKGCGFIGLICRSQDWARVAEPVNQTMDQPQGQ